MRNKGKELIQKLVRGKELLRKEHSRLPFERKIEMVVALQELAAGFPRRSAGTSRRVWKV